MVRVLLVIAGALAVTACGKPTDQSRGIDGVTYVGPSDDRLSFERNSDGAIRSLLSGGGETLVDPVIDCSTHRFVCVAFRGRVFAVPNDTQQEFSEEPNGATIRQVGCVGLDSGKCVEVIFRSDCAFPLREDDRCSDQGSELSDTLTIFYVYSSSRGVTAFGDAAECRFSQTGFSCDATGIVFRLESARGILAP